MHANSHHKPVNNFSVYHNCTFRVIVPNFYYSEYFSQERPLQAIETCFEIHEIKVEGHVVFTDLFYDLPRYENGVDGSLSLPELTLLH